MELKEIILILKRLYREHISRYLKRIIFSIFLSLLVAGATSATAWLLDPAIKKIFINNDPTYAWLIPLSIILAFITKGLSLYFARMNIIKVGGRIGGELQKRIANFVINTDVKTLENRHSGKFISNIFYDAGAVTQLVSTGVLNLMKDSFSLIALVSLMYYQNWKLASFAVFMMPLAIIFAKRLGKRIGKVQGEAGITAGNLTVFLSEIFKAAKMIRIIKKKK